MALDVKGDENSLPRWVCLTSICTANLMVCLRPAEPIPAHLGDLCDRVRNSEAVVGFAQDPDADRLVLVDERGVPIHEECTLALAATWVLRHRGPGVLVWPICRPVA